MKKKPTTLKNTGHLCSIYCPDCGKVTDKISFNLLREAKKVEASCPVCHGITIIEYDGERAKLWHFTEELEQFARTVMKEKSEAKKAKKG